MTEIFLQSKIFKTDNNTLSSQHPEKHGCEAIAVSWEDYLLFFILQHFYLFLAIPVRMFSILFSFKLQKWECKIYSHSINFCKICLLFGFYPLWCYYPGVFLLPDCNILTSLRFGHYTASATFLLAWSLRTSD